jgi:hypothetical protein
MAAGEGEGEGEGGSCMGDGAPEASVSVGWVFGK